MIKQSITPGMDKETISRKTISRVNFRYMFY